MDSKKDFMDFIRDACDRQDYRERFASKMFEEGTKEDDLLELLQGWGYGGVSRQDCATLLHLSKHQGQSLKAEVIKY